MFTYGTVHVECIRKQTSTSKMATSSPATLESTQRYQSCSPPTPATSPEKPKKGPKNPKREMSPLGHVVDFFALLRNEVAGRNIQRERGSARNIDRRIGPDNDANYQCESEPRDGCTAKQEKTGQHRQGRETRDHRPAQNLIDRGVNDLLRRAAPNCSEILTNSVKNNYRIV